MPGDHWQVLACFGGSFERKVLPLPREVGRQFDLAMDVEIAKVFSFIFSKP